jgi:GNAT superfamily N-acetyltransferase
MAVEGEQLWPAPGFDFERVAREAILAVPWGLKTPIPREEGQSMTNDVAIRRGEPSDAETLAEFNIAMAWETERKRLDAPTVTRGVQAVLKNANYGFYVVAVAEDRVVGSLLVTYEWSDWRCGLLWWIQSVYVRPSFRRRGVFTRLHEFLQDEASRAPQICGLRLYVEDSNRTAQQVYTTLGMKRTPYHIYEQQPAK